MEFYVLLTVHLGSVLANNQLDAHFFFRIYLFQFSACFEHSCAHHQKNSIQTCTLDGHLHRMTYTRCRINTIDFPDDEHRGARNM